MLIKKDVKVLLKSCVKLRKDQIREIEEGYIKPLKDDLDMLKQCIKGEVSVQEYKKHALMVNGYILKLIGDKKA